MRVEARVVSSSPPQGPRTVSTKTQPPLTRADWLIPAGLLVLALIPAIAGAVRVAGLASGAEITPENARFVAAPLPIILHIVGALLFSILGAFQFSPGLRRRYLRWHRLSGRIALPAGLVVAGSGIWMTLTYEMPAMDGVAVYLERLVFGIAMAVSLVLGVVYVLRRDIPRHSAWMLRGYALGMAAGTQVITHLPWFILVGQPTEGPRAVMMGAGWVINLMIAEWLISRRRPMPVRLQTAQGAHSSRTFAPANNTR